MNDPHDTPAAGETRKQTPADIERQTRDAPRTLTQIGRFEVRRVLGGGTFGCVYLAFDPDLNREVAVKVPVGLTTASRDQFLREARASAGIHHANVCPVFEVGTVDDVPFIVSRYVADGTLADLLKRTRERTGRPLAPADAVKFVRKLALGLAAAHAKGIVHRDLKPSNVLYDANHNEVLITDFGLAKLLDQASLSSSGGMKGTPAYMSPEQFGDGEKAGDVTPLSDVYSLGVILYELLTGRLPFAGNPFALMLAHIQTPPERPSARLPGLDAKFDAPCLKALAKNPADRHASAKDFAQALADCLQSSAVFVLPVPQPVITRAQTEAGRRAQAVADYRRGDKYYYGSGVPQDYEKAFEWYEKAAQQGHADAQFSLGVMFEHGRGVPQDYAKAREWYEKAAAQGDASALCGLGELYENGHSVVKDLTRALELYRKAAAQGSEDAKEALKRLSQTESSSAVHPRG